MATVKRLKIRNTDYEAAIKYLTLQHDESTGKTICDDKGRALYRDEFIIEGINCDPYSYDIECEKTNAAYNKNQGKEEIKAHHYIVSFDPRDTEDNGLTIEKAQAIGMELAHKCFSGHQILVCTHPDGHNSSGNMHVHIVLNSVRKFTVPKQDFMERLGDACGGNKHRATKAFLLFFKQEVMNICQRENLYQVDLLNPAKDRITDREYWAKMHGQANQSQDFKTQKQILRDAIKDSISDSRTMDEFILHLQEDYRINVKETQGVFSYEILGREKAIRGRTLGTDYEKPAIEAAILRNIRTENAGKEHDTYIPQLRKLTDLSNCLKAKNNIYYRRAVALGNLKMMNKTMNFLHEANINTTEKLDAVMLAAKNEMDIKHASLLETENRIRVVNSQIHYTGQYLANKKVYIQYIHSKNRSKFRDAHISELLLFEAARKELKGDKKKARIPDLANLKLEKEKLLNAKNEQYEDYSYSRSKFRELQTAATNLKEILNAVDEPTQTRTQDR